MIGWFWDQFTRGGRQANEGVRGYRAIQYRATSSPNLTSADTNLEKSFEADGDTLTIFAITGGAPVYVRLGDDPNPFFRVREGMVLTRPFRKVTFRLGNMHDTWPGSARSGARVLAYASHGPLVQFPPKEYGFRRIPLTRDGLTVGTGLTTIASLLFGGSPVPTAGRFGGTLMIRNTGTVDLYLVGVGANQSAVYAGANQFGPIAPGETISLQLEQAIWDDGGVPSVDAGGLAFKTLAGSTTIALMLSCDEMDDALGDQFSEHVPGMR